MPNLVAKKATARQTGQEALAIIREIDTPGKRRALTESLIMSFFRKSDQQTRRLRNDGQNIDRSLLALCFWFGLFCIPKGQSNWVQENDEIHTETARIL